ncbi:hypothetical protein C8Q76DRAFT_770901 [Earliella scabrosa]|nr:hypothetical protein C8Q76DRAFT_771054 [Earliella scabrosa]KAI0707217.1 hypothetical protein C8Q76DRAFT_770901 [Earliella scabrosa]
MEGRRGVDRGSYIWGTSVHNTRIERLWFDVTHGFGGKWKHFFLELEQGYGLDADCDAHIWLIHHLFLHAINQDAHEWQESWNAHRLRIRGERAASPRELFMFGMIEHGPRGLEQIHAPPPVHEEPVSDLADYGVDWEVINDPRLMAHHREHNPVGADVNLSPSNSSSTPNPFATTSTPQRLSEVTCDPPRCPLTAQQVSLLNAHMALHFDLTTRDMLVRRQMWVAALEFCLQLF